MASQVMLTAIPHGVESGRKVRVSVLVSPRIAGGQLGPLSNWPTFLLGSAAAPPPPFSLHINGISHPVIIHQNLEPTYWQTWLQSAPVTTFRVSTPDVKGYDSKAVQHCIRRNYADFLAHSLPRATRNNFFSALRARAQAQAQAQPQPVAQPQSNTASFVKTFVEDHALFATPGSSRAVTAADSANLTAFRRDLARIAGRANFKPESFSKKALDTLAGTSDANPLAPVAAVIGRIERTSSTVDPKSAQKQTLDFHQRIALLTNYPILMRDLGLILEFEATLDAAIADTAAVTLQVEAPTTVQLGGLSVLNPKTHGQSLRDGFWPAPRTAGALSGGYLDLSTGYHLDIVSLESASALLGIFANSLNTLADANNPNVDLPYPPSLTTAGISLWREKRTDEIKAKVAAASTVPTDLFAEDLMMGMAVDIFCAENGVNRADWFPVTRRTETCTVQINGTTKLSETRDVGVRTGAVKPTDKFPDENKAPDQYLVTDALFTWDGPSLAVPRQQVDDDTLPDYGERTDIENPWSQTLQFHAEATENQVPLPFPPFRFGATYAVAARPVFINGKAPEFDQTKTRPLHLGSVLGRLEPVHPPRILTEENLIDERHKHPEILDTPELVAVRSRVSLNTKRKNGSQLKFSEVEGPFSTRYLVPAAITPKLARSHLAASDFHLLSKGFHRVGFNEQGDINNVLSSFEHHPKTPYYPDLLARAAMLTLESLSGDLLDTTTLEFYTNEDDEQWPNALLHCVEAVRSFDVQKPCFGKSSYRKRPGVTTSSKFIAVKLPPAWTVRLKMHYELSAEELDLMAVWHWFQVDPRYAGSTNYMRERLRKGHPMISPTREIRLIHAVDAPVTAPSVVITELLDSNTHLPTTRSLDSENRSVAAPKDPLHATITFDRKSTGSIQVRSDWNEWVDDPIQDRPALRHGSAVVLDYIAPEVVEPADAPPPKPLSISDTDDGIATGSFEIKHVPADNKYRRIHYQATAKSRYLPFFSDDVRPERRSERFVLEMLSTSRPPSPHVRYVLPYYEWSHSESEQSKSFSHSRTTGLRVFLERPWFATGDDELLGVVVVDQEGQMRNHAPVTISNSPRSYEISEHLTMWGGDPIYPAPTPVNNATLLLRSWTDAQPWQCAGSVFAGSPTPDLRFRPSEIGACGWGLQLPSVPGTAVGVVGYRPEYDEQRRVWYCDIPFSTPPFYGSFVRLGIVRYQPHSKPGFEISDVVMSDFAQLNPDRSLHISNLSPRSFIMELRGIPSTTQTIPRPGKPSINLRNEYELTFERRVYNDENDLGWREELDVVPERLTGVDARDTTLLSRWKVTPAAYCANRRLVVREYEQLLADTNINAEPYEICRRLVYADAVEIS